MRLIVIGSARARRDLRAALAHGRPEIVGEFESIADARRAGLIAEGMVMSPPAPPDPDGAPLVEAVTTRELEVLELVAEGLSNKAVAERLRISDQTVKFHMASIIGKLGAGNRTDAVRRAARRGLIVL